MKGQDPRESQFWMRLDNAAKIYPAVSNRNLTSVFRLSIELKERIRAAEILEAVQALDERFPYYKVRLRKGFFWYYLEYDNLPIPVLPDQGVPCRAFEKNQLMLRVLVRDRTISVEFSHILTDGHGALQFLKALTMVYLEKCGFAIPPESDYFRPGEMPVAEEYEDAYSRYFKKTKARIVKFPPAFHLPFSHAGPQKFRALTAVIPLDEVLQLVKTHHVSITEYLVAIYLFSLQAVYEKQSRIKKRLSRKFLRLLVPVNLRNIYPSRTMRNFSLYVLPGFDLRLGHYTFDEILKTVYHQMQLETDRKLISKLISRNVSGERNPFVRGAPLFIKSMILSWMYTINSKQYSGVVSNLGKIDFGPVVNSQADKVYFIPPPPNTRLKANCAVSGFDNKLLLTFGNVSNSTVLEREFFTFLMHRGITVKLMQPLKVKSDDYL